MSRLKHLIFCSFLLSSCAQKVDREDGLLFLQSGSKDYYMSCNVFADETFRGYVWAEESETLGCVNVEINKSPKDLFKGYNLFLQVYPFEVEEGKIKYGSSLPIRTVKKHGDNEPLIESQLIDTYLLEEELALQPDQFFSDHFFKICEVDERWKGLQFVVYERRKEENIPLRATKFLLPPFLMNPEIFRDSHGNTLAAFHPFLEHTLDKESKPDSYNDLAEEICRSDF